MSKSLKDQFSGDPADTDEPPISREALIAQAATRPNLMAAHTISRFNHVVGDIELMEMAHELNTQISRIQQGNLGRVEETLAAQAITLDTLFNALAVKALQAPGAEQQALILKLALQSQRQCCQTYETLSTLKKPPAVTMVSQTNIGQAVQVNNSAVGNQPQTILENELLEISHGERLDSGTQITAIATHQDMAALAELNRSSD
ncbi:hypothetical protein [Methylobacter sp. BlB1]|jgi:hypothetical protein|uniref:hypothetical protein n=1 Tax=Methylobacter sp. BlB1 TaxID=2785914 RepID=UPI0018941949|nr:hypothetical protein [Methylobacter sp. BlB1]MBF6650913.1 hypothetical protein [Methylobacter sp. BlB1]